MDSGNIGNTVVTGSGSGDLVGPVLAPGEMVTERYKVIKLLGHGGMGSVYKVEQVFLRQFFALKTLTGQNFPEVAVRRFQKEAQAASKLNHPNLVRAHDFGMLSTHQPFFVMDLIVGENLSDYCKRIGTLSLEEVLRIFIPVCFALGYAHSEGIVHRDIKPGNIMLDRTAGPDEPYTPKVVDFGIAKLTDDEGGHSVNLTRTGEIFGTPLYMSPEQCLGTKIDHRTDIYSLGCVMYEALTGAPPFYADSALSLMMKHQSQEAPSLKEASMGREFPEVLEAIVAKTMAKDPSNRYQSLLDLAQDLAVLQQGQADSTASMTTARTAVHQYKTAARPKSSSYAVSAAIAIASILIGIAVGVSLPRTDKEEIKTPVNPEDAVSLNVQHIEVGTKPIVKVIGKGPQATRLYRFPSAFEIGTYSTADSKGEVVKEKPVRGDFEVPFTQSISFHFHQNDLTNNPNLLRGFGEYDINGIQIESERHGDLGVFSNGDIVYDVSLTYLSRMKALTQVLLYGTQTSDVGIRSLEESPNLINIDVSDTQVTASGFRRLKRFPDLLIVGISSIKDGRTLLPELARSKIIGALYAQNLDLSDSDVRLLSDLKTLHMLDLGRNPQITNAGIESISHLPLSSLKFSGTAVTPAITPVLISMKTLMWIEVDADKWTRRDIQALQTRLPKIKVSAMKLDKTSGRWHAWDWRQEP